jgi:hypothetical protein
MADKSQTFDLIQIGPTFAVQVNYPEGGVGYTWGFRTRDDALAWIEQEQAKATTES